MPNPHNLLVLASMPLAPDAIVLADGKGTSRIQVAKTIKSAKKGDLKFDITADHLDQIVANSKRTSQQIPIDYNHLSLNAILPEQAVAAGWFTDLERDGDKLFGNAEFTETAAEKIRKKEFRYISPVIFFKGLNEQGADIGARLFSAALTIYPFLQGMEPVALTELIAHKIVLADLSLDERRARLSEALNKRYPVDYVYIEDNGIYDDYVVFRKTGKCYSLGYKVNSDFTVEFSGDPVEVVVQWEPVSVAATEQPGDIMAENNPNKDFVALQEQVATLTTTVNTLKTQAETFAATAKTEKERADGLQVRLNTQDANIAVDALVRQRKIKVDAKEKWVALYLKDKEQFEAIATTLTASTTKLDVEHGSNEGDTDEHDSHENGGKSATVELTEAVDKYIADNGGKGKVQYGDAMREVARLNPELARRYREEASEPVLVETR